MHRNGCDPDFRVTRRFNIDVQPLIDALVEKSQREDERKKEELTAKLEQAIAARQEMEAELELAKKTISELSSGAAPSGPNGVMTTFLYGMYHGMASMLHYRETSDLNAIIYTENRGVFFSYADPFPHLVPLNVNYSHSS